MAKSDAAIKMLPERRVMFVTRCVMLCDASVFLRFQVHLDTNFAYTSAFWPLQAALATKVLAERADRGEELAKAFHTTSAAETEMPMKKPTPPKDVEMGFLNTILQRARGASNLPSASAPALPTTAAEAVGT